MIRSACTAVCVPPKCLRMKNLLLVTRFEPVMFHTKKKAALKILYAWRTCGALKALNARKRSLEIEHLSTTSLGSRLPTDLLELILTKALS